MEVGGKIYLIFIFSILFWLSMTIFFIYIDFARITELHTKAADDVTNWVTHVIQTYNIRVLILY